SGRQDGDARLQQPRRDRPQRELRGGQPRRPAARAGGRPGTDRGRRRGRRGGHRGARGPGSGATGSHRRTRPADEIRRHRAHPGPGCRLCRTAHRPRGRHPRRGPPVPPLDLPAAHHAEEYADTFGGIAAPQDAVAAIEPDDPAKKEILDATVRAIFAPVIDVHYVTIKQLAQLEPTLVETIACMVGELLNESLQEAVHTMGVPEDAARAILYGHTQVALANGLRGDNPFSDACLIAMNYGRESIIKDDWKKVFRDEELDKNLARMLHLDRIER